MTNSKILRQKRPSTEMSWMANRRMIVQIMPSVIFRFPSTISAEGKRYYTL